MGDANSDADDGVEYEAEEFKIGPHSFSVTTIALMPIETLMANHGKAVEISGQKLWCGSLAVAEYLMGENAARARGGGDGPLLSGATVVELGAGTGVLGMLCRRLGAGRVLLTDNDARSLAHMRRDCASNGIDGAEVLALDWFAPTVPSGIVEAMRLDARGAPLLVVAGDVLYKRCLLQPFFATAKALLLLRPPGPRSGGPDVPEDATGHDRPHRPAQLVLCHVPRAGVEQSDVRQAACAAGLAVAEVDRDAWLRGASLEYCPAEDTGRAEVYTMTLLP